MRSISFLLAAALAGTSACVVDASPRPGVVVRDGYAFLGQRWVHGTGQPVHEAIGHLARDGAFSSIRLVVANAPLQMDDVWVTFGNGQVWHPGTRLAFGPGSTTRQIGLPGGVRHVRRVDFVMNNFPGNGSAKVELWGR